ncbi:MAG: hypothetical protein IKJ87_05255 [Ruminococcus sp.]|nr:hypothetical protein [Ruminococcus sp.]
MKKDIYRKVILLIVTTISLVLLYSCKDTSDNVMEPLLGIEWFSSYDNVKSDMESYTLLSERENKEQKVPQKMQDYTGVELFGQPCDLTLCFADSGLIGFNYHDVEKNQDYKSWYNILESNYGVTSEEGSGMAAWFDSPVGNDTAIYLFNLQEGVQVSIYATSDSPDKSYEKKDKDETIPVVEIRTPIVPVLDDDAEKVTYASNVSASAEISAVTTTVISTNEDVQDTIDNNSDDVTDESITDEDTENKINDTTTSSDKRKKTGTSVKSSNTGKKNNTEKNTTIAVENKTEPIKDKKKTFLLDGLAFYGSPDSEKKKMSSYKQCYEYQTEDPEQPWELIMEYENVKYLNKKMNCVLCFTSLGLVGVNYFNSDVDNYKHFVKALTEIYGEPDKKKNDYTAWTKKPVGKGTMIYVIVLEDGVQISFFADDTGSELAKENKR